MIRRRGSGASRDGRGRARDPRGRRHRRRRGGRGVSGVLRRRDGDDRAARRRPRDLLGRERRRRGTSTASSTVPAATGARDACSCRCPFGEEVVHYAVGPASCAVRACPAGSTRSGAAAGGCRGRGSSSPRCGSRARASPLPARARGVPRDARAGDDAGPRRRASTRPDGRLLGTGDVLEQPGLVGALELVADEGAGARLPGLDRGGAPRLLGSAAASSRAADLEAYEAGWSAPRRGRACRDARS